MCGKPWERVVEHKPMVIAKTDRSEMGKYGRTQSSGTMEEAASTRTLGWKPACKCDCAETKPAVVLDPFGGAGTVGLVAKQLLRDYLLIELNPKYVAMAQSRLDAVNPLFGEVTNGS
jgi:hypothetical protein